MNIKMNQILILLIVGVVAFFAYKMFFRRPVALPGTAGPGQAPTYAQPPVYGPAVSANQLPATGSGYGAATGGGYPASGGFMPPQGTSGAQDFANIASGIGSLAQSAIGLAGAFGGLGGGGTWNTDTGSDTYYGGGPGDDASDPSYYMY